MIKFLKKQDADKKKGAKSSSLYCGPDGTRTRDPLRDRQVF